MATVFNDFPPRGDGTSLPGGGTAISGGGLERQTQVAERRSGPFRLNLTTGPRGAEPEGVRVLERGESEDPCPSAQGPNSEAQGRGVGFMRGFTPPYQLGGL